MQCLRTTGMECVGLLHRLLAAPEVLSESNHFPVSSALNCPYFWNCSNLPQHHPPFQRCQLRTFHVQAPAVCPPRKPEMQFVVGNLCLLGGGNKPFLQKGHGSGTDGRGSRGTCVPCVCVMITAGWTWLEGGWCSHTGFSQNPGFKHSLRK